MSVLAALVLAVAFGPAALLIAAIAIALARRARRHRLPTLTPRQAADNLRPYGADITIAPARAPRNGNTHDPINR